MATLLITKKPSDEYSFILNGDSQTEIINLRTDLTVVGGQCHFKTSNGANLIKEQNILFSDVTLVASGTFTFVSVFALFAKLKEVGFFDWINGLGVGGTTKFSELDDTFGYFGKAGQAVVVSDDELSLETVSIYNYRNFVDLEDTFNAIVPNKMLATNSTGTGIILKDLPENQVTNLPFYNKITAKTGFTLVGLDLTINPLWAWTLQGIDYTNTDSHVKTFVLSQAGLSRFVYVIPNSNNGFDVIEGQEGVTPFAPQIPYEGVYVTYLLITDTLATDNGEPDLSDYATINYSDAQDLLKVDKVTGYSLTKNDLTDTLKTNYDVAYTHSQTTHAPSNAQKNSDITKAEIEAKLIGEITTHTHPASGGGVGENIVFDAGISRTLAVTDLGKTIVFTGSNPIDLILPVNASVPIVVGFKVKVTQQGAGVVTASNTGVTVISNVGSSSVVGETRTYVKTDTDTWSIEGNNKSSSFAYSKNFYIDTINGTDATGKEGDNTKPFKTIDACVPYFGDLTNTTVIHLMTTGIYYFNSTVLAVNINIISNVKCTLSFINNTNERPFTTGGSGLIQYFRILAPFLKLEYSSTIAQRIIANYIELDIDEFYNNFSNTLSPFQTDRFDIKINKITFNNNRLILSNAGSIASKNTLKCPNIVVNKMNSLLIEVANVNAYTIADIRGVVSGIGSIKFSVFTGEVHVGNLTTTGGNAVIGYGDMVCKTFFYNSKFSGTFIDIGSYLNTNHTLTGSFQSTSAPLGGDLSSATGVLTFDNLTAKLDSNFNLGVQALTVKDSHLTTDGIPFGRRSGIESKVIQFFGSNSIISANPTVIFGSNFTNNVDFYYPLKSNIPSLGLGITSVNKATITYP